MTDDVKKQIHALRLRIYRQRLKDKGWRTLRITLPGEVFDEVDNFRKIKLAEWNLKQLTQKGV
jgi:hypothetical protein